jgi:cytochrome b6-f complex iron-sulfur subunit
MACHDCLNRREFLTKAAMGAAVLAALEACGDGQIGPPVGNGVDLAGRVNYDLKNYPGLANVGTLVDISTNTAPDRAAIRTSATTFLAFSKLCTHQQCPTDIRNNEFQCPCHNSRFDKTGAVLNGPNIPSPPIAPLSRLPTSFDGGSILTVG